jgi:putative oxidoreductase
MEAGQRTSKAGAADGAALIARLILAASFLYMGFAKARDPGAFAKVLNEYHTGLSPFVLNSIAASLPWFEVFCGLLLIAGIAVRGTALAVLAMLIPFTSLVLRRGLMEAAQQNIAFCAVKFDCGCGNGVVPVCHKLPENCALIALALWLMLRSSGRFCLWFALFKKRNPGSPAAPQTSA